MIQRLDPEGCGCTDCTVGDHSAPLNEASEEVVFLAAVGDIANATNRDAKDLMNYLEDGLGREFVAYRKGFLDAAKAFAFWQDGRQICGVNTALDDIREQPNELAFFDPPTPKQSPS